MLLALGIRAGYQGLTFERSGHENYGTYEVRESNASYGQPIPNLSLVYQPRMLQLGFRTTF